MTNDVNVSDAVSIPTTSITFAIWAVKTRVAVSGISASMTLVVGAVKTSEAVSIIIV